ncbi:transposase [Paenibacillus athensensis]|uniref:Transposase n=1 Tax=Paenibacillus athensensis TaxID=1967502 RepID=A0A4Y8Q302_9BACL|nr:transposase [Paenibacillus athensensis]MCD1259201.1 transposase [Paenibacillus athensensis]
MFPQVRTHSQYQHFVVHQLRLHYPRGFLPFIAKDLPLLLKFWLTDLSGTAALLQHTFHVKGPIPHDPANLLRSYLLMLQMKEVSVTRWVAGLHRCDFFAILSGFEPGHIPGVGTFYDFFRRLWSSPKAHLTGRMKPALSKPPKGKKGEKAPTTSTGKVERLAARIAKYPLSRVTSPCDTLFALFREQFLMISASLGLLGDVQNLSIAADGTPLRTSAFPRSKRLCDCREKGFPSCSCKRLYTQPDCDVGWDSSRECYFHGYHLYMLTAADSKHDLPLYPRLHRASRHDSISILVSSGEFSSRFPGWAWKKVLLDAAHDAMPIYRHFLDKQVEPFIDLNKRKAGILKYKDDISLSPHGIPICKKGLEMKSDGFDYARRRRKYRCPLVKNRVLTCDTPCSNASCGRTIYLYAKDNPRLFPPVARGSEEWKRIYSRRTTVERCNKREKVDYMLEAAKHRSTRMWTIRLYGIMMCQHMDAWAEERTLDLQSILFAA